MYIVRQNDLLYSTMHCWVFEYNKLLSLTVNTNYLWSKTPLLLFNKLKILFNTPHLVCNFLSPRYVSAGFPSLGTCNVSLLCNKYKCQFRFVLRQNVSRTDVKWWSSSDGHEKAALNVSPYPLGDVTTDLWLFGTGPAQMKAILWEADLCFGRFFCAFDSSIHTLHSYFFVNEDQVFVYIGQYSFLFLSLFFYPPPSPPTLLTVGSFIFSITWSKGGKEVLHTKNEGRVFGPVTSCIGTAC